MVNKKGGKKHKRGKKDNFQTKELRKKDNGQEYAQIKTCKGNCRFDVMCFDGIERIANLCGTMRKRKFVNVRQVVLVSLRDFQDGKCDIIDSYDDYQVNLLRELNEIPDHIQLDEQNEFQDINDDIIFEYDNDIDNDIDLDEI